MLILLFGSVQASAQQRNLEFWTYFSVIYFLCSAAKEGFQTQLFKTRVLTQPDFENPKKINFKPEKGHFWFTLKGPRYSHSSSGFNSKSGTNVSIFMLILTLWTCSFNFLGPKTHCEGFCSDIVFFYKADTPKGPYISFNQKNECLWLFPDVSTELPREHYLLMSAQLGRLVIF